ncbi:hypothetical protein M758_2G131400 [Ceratodon purpureus]|nr:hypothetical protein M758_2G131400 [Ceratodon purpureus]KAG0626501.1 hypothetical protein M758_2G131400 [Ceratodon purpureus]
MDSNGRVPSGGIGKSLHHEEEIVIVGGGIGGLACALALHRVGIKAVVLEQSDALRAGGSALALWNNAFNVLEVLGLSEQFRTMFTNLLAWEIMNSQGKTLAKLEFAECEGGPHDLRAVERSVVLEALARELPEGSIRFNSRVSGIKKTEGKTGITEVELQDGSTYSAKVIIGFDGINSCVASWMGLQKAQSVGQVGIRGMAIFPEGHKFEEKAQLFLGKGCRTAYLPTSPTKVFWFIVWNDSSEGWQNTSEEVIKEESLQQVLKSFPSTPLTSIITNTPVGRISKSTLRHRLNTDPESLVNGTVTVAGDAAHPTTPNMGQGGCMALEDALILTQKLYDAIRSPNTEEMALPEHERIHRALVEFQLERHERTNFITTRSYRIGRMLQTGWTVIDFVRDRFVIPLLLNKKTFLAHTLFDVGKLPDQ